MSPAVRLDPESVEAVARRVAQLLADDRPARLVDAQAIADALGIARATVYDHAAELGARRLGDGPRARLRFDLAEARERWTARATATPSTSEAPPARSRHRSAPASSPAVPLLPIRDRRAA